MDLSDTLMNCIELNNITKAYTGKTAVNQLSLAIPEGSIYGFIGPNGSGKTTTLRMILNIIYPDSGSIKVFGEPYQSSHRKRIGYLPEERGLYKKMKVADLISFFSDIKGSPVSRKEIKSWLDRFELADTIDKKVDSLSKGMSQKVQFICTVISNPELLILDEPFSGLDPVNTEVMRQTIIDLRQQGTTIVFSTHDMSTAERMCDRIFMIYSGNKVLDGSLEEIQNQYGTDTLRLRTTGKQNHLHSIPGVLKVTDFGQEQELRLAPEADPQSILKQLVGTVAIQRFEIIKPSLHDIFVRIANPKSSDSEVSTSK